MTALVAKSVDLLNVHGIVNWFKKLSAEMKRRRNIKNTINQLSRLSDYDLNDIGISRGDIRYVAHKSYPKEAGGEMVEVNRNIEGWV